MRPWIKASPHWSLLEYLEPPNRETMVESHANGGVGTGTNPDLPPFFESPSPQPLVEVQSTALALKYLLAQGITSLCRLAECTKGRAELPGVIPVQSFADRRQIVKNIGDHIHQGQANRRGKGILA